MQTNVRFIGALALVLATASAHAADSVKATVNGMVCAFCAQGIEKRLSKMPATHAVFVDLKSKVVVVEAKEGQTLDDESIAAEIKDSGYDVVRLEKIQQSVAEIKARAKAAKR